MDPVCPPGLLLLPLLLMGTGLSVATPGVTGISPIQDPFSCRASSSPRARWARRVLGFSHPSAFPKLLHRFSLLLAFPRILPVNSKGTLLLPKLALCLPARLRSRGNRTSWKVSPLANWRLTFPSLALPLLLPLGNNAEICLLPREDGPCRALIPSYFYDRASQSCQFFYYGGCHGNANNFDNLDACNDACWRIESKCSWRTSETIVLWYYFFPQMGLDISAQFSRASFLPKFEPVFSQRVKLTH